MVTLGHVGLGVWGQNLVRTFAQLERCRLKTICDVRMDALEKMAKYFHGRVEISQDVQTVLGDPDIDAVVIATPAVTHAKLVLEALNAGKHVFVEKPLALSVSDGARIVAEAQRLQKVVMVGHLLLYHPAIQKLKTAISEGQLGDVHYMYSSRVNLGQIREEENALWSLTAHDISVAMHVLDARPTEVVATGRAFLRREIQDVVFVTLFFGSDRLSHIHASWLDPHKIRKFTVVGSQKMAVFDDMESTEKLRFYDKGVQWQKHTGSYDSFLTIRHGDIYIPKIDMVEPLKLECQHFVDAIDRHQPVLTDAQNGLDVLHVLSAAQESLNSNGKPVRIFHS